MLNKVPQSLDSIRAQNKDIMIHRICCVSGDVFDMIRDLIKVSNGLSKKFPLIELFISTIINDFTTDFGLELKENSNISLHEVLKEVNNITREYYIINLFKNNK